jgi:hypothetical protein
MLFMIIVALMDGGGQNSIVQLKVVYSIVQPCRVISLNCISST